MKPHWINWQTKNWIGEGEIYEGINWKMVTFVCVLIPIIIGNQLSLDKREES